jgi:hypothetical protein
MCKGLMCKGLQIMVNRVVRPLNFLTHSVRGFFLYHILQNFCITYFNALEMNTMLTAAVFIRFSNFISPIQVKSMK